MRLVLVVALRPDHHRRALSILADFTLHRRDAPRADVGRFGCKGGRRGEEEGGGNKRTGVHHELQLQTMARWIARWAFSRYALVLSFPRMRAFRSDL